MTYATYNNTVQYNVISLVELKFTIVTLLKKLNIYVCGMKVMMINRCFGWTQAGAGLLCFSEN